LQFGLVLAGGRSEREPLPEATDCPLLLRIHPRDRTRSRAPVDPPKDRNRRSYGSTSTRDARQVRFASVTADRYVRQHRFLHRDHVRLSDRERQRASDRAATNRVRAEPSRVHRKRPRRSRQ
jgi:hypothetical protein